MRNIKLVYSYDGTDFLGFQRQEEGRTIQNEIEKAIFHFTNEKINLITSGRTDKGVHAFMQVSNFFTESKIPGEKFKYILNRRLPLDVCMISSEEVNENFHARHSTKERTYVYYIKEQENYNIFDRNFVYYYNGKINIDKLQNILNPLVGRHNFESFRMTDCSSEHAIREIYSIKVKKEGERVAIYLTATSFVKSMVRIIIGSALKVHKGIRKEDYIIKKLENPNPLDEKLVAPPNGLYLYNIKY